MATELPRFNSAFLSEIAQSLQRRRKALKYHGSLEWKTVQPDDFEWLTLNFNPIVGNYCIFQFVEDNRASIYVRSKRSADRGKVLVAIEDINVIGNGPSVIEAIETTIRESDSIDSGAVRNAWAKVEVRIAQ